MAVSMQKYDFLFDSPNVLAIIFWLKLSLHLCCQKTFAT